MLPGLQRAALCVILALALASSLLTTPATAIGVAGVEGCLATGARTPEDYSVELLHDQLVALLQRDLVIHSKRLDEGGPFKKIASTAQVAPSRTNGTRSSSLSGTAQAANASMNSTVPGKIAEVPFVGNLSAAGIERALGDGVADALADVLNSTLAAVNEVLRPLDKDATTLGQSIVTEVKAAGGDMQSMMKRLGFMVGKAVEHIKGEFSSVIIAFNATQATAPLALRTAGLGHAADDAGHGLGRAMVNMEDARGALENISWVVKDFGSNASLQEVGQLLKHLQSVVQEAVSKVDELGCDIMQTATDMAAEAARAFHVPAKTFSAVEEQADKLVARIMDGMEDLSDGVDEAVTAVTAQAEKEKSGALRAPLPGRVGLALAVVFAALCS